MNPNKNTKRKIAKLGATARWADRNKKIRDILVAVAPFTTKTQQRYIERQNTKTIQAICAIIIGLQLMKQDRKQIEQGITHKR